MPSNSYSPDIVEKIWFLTHWVMDLLFMHKPESYDLECELHSQRKDKTVHDLDLIRAAADDVASARVLLQERTAALDALIQTALNHGIPMSHVAKASEPSMIGNEPPAEARQSLLVA